MNTEIRPTDRKFPWLPSGFYRVAMGQGNAYDILISRDHDDYSGAVLRVGVEGIGFQTFSDNPDGFTHWSYVQEKLRGVPAHNFADFINDQCDRKTERQGDYE